MDAASVKHNTDVSMYTIKEKYWNKWNNKLIYILHTSNIHNNNYYVML